MTNVTPLTLPNPEDLFTLFTEKISPLLQHDTALVGIQTGGVWIMQRLLSVLAEQIKTYNIQHGVLDVSMHRDDYATRGLKGKMQPSKLPFDVQNKHIILIDDIFYTGRTIRAAMNELFDYGRPASIHLAVLINRGGHELPIMPDVCGHEIALNSQQYLLFAKNGDGTFSLSEKASS